MEREGVRFCDLVCEKFSFLERENGYSRQECERVNFEYWQEATVVAKYLDPRRRVDVRVCFHIAGSDISVIFVELREGISSERISFWGDEGYLRAVTLDSIVEYLTDGKIPSALPRSDNRTSRAEVSRRKERRARMLQNEMDKVLEILAERCKIYALKILLGDTSSFVAVQQLHTQKYDI